MKIVFNYSGRFQATPEIKCISATEQHTKSTQRSFFVPTHPFCLIQNLLIQNTIQAVLSFVLLLKSKKLVLKHFGFKKRQLVNPLTNRNSELLQFPMSCHHLSQTLPQIKPHLCL